jgi:hypothetical protein
MPRSGNTPKKTAYHHKAMSSASHGKGADAKLRAAKKFTAGCPHCQGRIHKRKEKKNAAKPSPVGDPERL